MITNIAIVALGGFFGAMSRYGLGLFFKKRYPSAFPIGTLFVNLLGSFLLGLIMGANTDSTLRLLLGTGFMGAFTTFSTFKLENIQLHTKGKINVAVLYLAISYTCGILLAFLGISLGGK
ncbi:fluoride efflux transporter CrcB [Neobacillus rhizosphaerae]|uniref:fluoride efflux transporter CrcB n=1 Tax=Neobacillus rhizosphaerae TaxID=2880965 RepID=UPI003D280856